VKRRAFITLLGGALAVSPVAAQEGVRRIGVLMNVRPQPSGREISPGGVPAGFDAKLSCLR
jgi:hypothetical protein